MCCGGRSAQATRLAEELAAAREAGAEAEARAAGAAAEAATTLAAAEEVERRASEVSKVSGARIEKAKGLCLPIAHLCVGTAWEPAGSPAEKNRVVVVEEKKEPHPREPSREFFRRAR